MDGSQQDDFRPAGGFPRGNNPFCDNPYASPTLDAATRAGETVFPPGRGKVHHVRTVAILMIIQGILEVVMGMLLIVMGIGMPFFLRWQAAQHPNKMDLPSADMTSFILTIFYAGTGIVLLTSAGLLIFAGIRNYQFRHRRFGIAALGSSMATLLSCYCAPTAIGLLTYGLIVYLDPAVTKAFAARQAELDRTESGRVKDAVP